jgi:hypothetical protein
MPVYQINYDIKKRNDFEYGPLTEALENLGAVRTLLSTWMLANDASQKAVYDHFLPFVHKDDRLMVIRVYDRPNWNNGLLGTRDFIDLHWPQ